MITSSTPIFRQASKKLSTFRRHRAIVNLGYKNKNSIKFTLFRLQIDFNFRHLQQPAMEHEYCLLIVGEHDLPNDTEPHRQLTPSQNLLVMSFSDGFQSICEVAQSIRFLLFVDRIRVAL